MATEEESIEQAAAARRERLRALRAAQELLHTPDEVDPNSNADGDANGDTDDGTRDSNPSMKFRNYVPQDKELQEAKLAAPVLPKFEDPVAAAAAAPPDNKEDPFLNIAPKKPNWDLRRDVQKKLDKLERRSQKAMFKLMEQQEKEKQLAEDVSNGGED